MERKKEESKRISKIQQNKKKKANLEMRNALKRMAKLTSSLERVAAAGGVIPINLKVGRNFGKSDKVAITMFCCGPHFPPPYQEYSSHWNKYSKYNSHYPDYIKYIDHDAD